MIDGESLEQFEACRPMLMGIAYRVLGSVTDASDVVQDTYLAWASASRDGIDNPRAWLATVCTRRAIDAGRAAHRRRVDYVGPWLPDFVRDDRTPEDLVELDATVTMAFQLVLQRLGVRERAAFVLREVFSVEYGEIAQALDTSTANARQLVARARRRLAEGPARHQPSPADADRLLTVFRAAIRSGSTRELAPLLAGDVTLSADSGGRVPSIAAVLDDRASVFDAIEATLWPAWRDLDASVAWFNGQPGLELRHTGSLHAAVAFTFGPGGLVSRIDIMRHPDKLASIEHGLR